MIASLLAAAFLLAPVFPARAAQERAIAGRQAERRAAVTRPAARRELEQGGTHWRLETPRGAVHVWRPKGYRSASAATVIYLHGYFTDVDGAWRDHDLARQFRASGRNALFIAAESPVSNSDPVRWTDLESLLRAAQQIEFPIPRRQVVVVAHSGAFRTVVPWLRSPQIDEVILLDGLYNNLADFSAWLQGSTSRAARRLVLVGFETAERSELLLTAFPDAKTREGIPGRIADVRRGERHARLLYVRSQYGHMELVTEGRCIPTLLKMGALPPL